MDFALRFLVLVLFTAALLAVSTEQWKKYNWVLMLGYLFAAGLIFLL